jgi:hypothetical protein
MLLQITKKIANYGSRFLKVQIRFSAKNSWFNYNTLTLVGYINAGRVQNPTSVSPLIYRINYKKPIFLLLFIISSLLLTNPQSTNP